MLGVMSVRGEDHEAPDSSPERQFRFGRDAGPIIGIAGGVFFIIQGVLDVRAGADAVWLMGGIGFVVVGVILVFTNRARSNRRS